MAKVIALETVMRGYIRTHFLTPEQATELGKALLDPPEKGKPTLIERGEALPPIRVYTTDV